MKTILPVLISLFILASCQLRNDEERTPPNSILGHNLTTNTTFSSSIDTVIELSHGTKIIVDKGSFEDKNGNKINGKIELITKEVISPMEILKENISTISEKGILETGGMLKIDAYSDGEEIRIRNGKQLKILLPNQDSIYQDMDLYMGVENENGIVEWELSDSTQQIQDTINTIVKSINIRYKFVSDLDTKSTDFKNNSSGIETIDDLVTFSEAEVTQLLNETIRIHWLLFDDGDLGILHIEGNISERKKNEIKEKLNGAPFIKPFKREGDVYDMNGTIEIRFIEIIENTFSDEFYVLAVSKFGWINCDIFIELDVPKINLEVEAEKNMLVKVMFENYDTYISGYWRDSTYHFGLLPEGEPIKILAVTEEDETFMYSITEGVVQNEMIKLAPLEKSNIEELENVIDAM